MDRSRLGFQIRILWLIDKKINLYQATRDRKHLRVAKLLGAWIDEDLEF